VAQTVLDWRLDGIETDPRIEDWGRLPAVTLEEFETFYRAINDRPATWIIVGDPAELDIEALSHLGTVERLEPSDLRR
jgi:hypothetical protein